ncbi:YecA/YgfB family protein [Azospirillum isscasi]|uniref:Transcriptional regulator n=1 Tax=Azospirillum isscasi TaxID=3053926 RepID=A0ABU0WHT1_9PROT|nr:hypothetical protein [Azospirillum isscasi]MDQ2103720.1 hypothetical protein [Azospirillum isscasi]
MSSAYRGDETLAQLLAQAGVPQTPADIRSLVAGVLAAPEGMEPDGWMVLVGERLPEELAGQLRALKAGLAAGRVAEAPDRADALADFVLVAMMGLSAAARDGADRAALERVAAMAGRAFRRELSGT